MKLSNEMFERIFTTARSVHLSEKTLAIGSAELVSAYGLNPNSVKITIRSLIHLFQGERYRRAITIDLTDYALRRINENYGGKALRIALRGLSAHIDYRQSFGNAVPGLQSLLSKHSQQHT